MRNKTALSPLLIKAVVYTRTTCVCTLTVPQVSIYIYDIIMQKKQHIMDVLNTFCYFAAGLKKLGFGSERVWFKKRGSDWFGHYGYLLLMK